MEIAVRTGTDVTALVVLVAKRSESYMFVDMKKVSVDIINNTIASAVSHGDQLKLFFWEVIFAINTFYIRQYYNFKMPIKQSFLESFQAPTGD